MCGKCRGASFHKLKIYPIFNNLRVGHTGEQFQLLQRKGVYPYEYMGSWEKFKDNHFLPIKTFYSKLNLSDIGESDYDHAQWVWRVFGMKNLGNYHNLCLKTNVLLMCDVFETFRMTFLEHYSLDLVHLYTSPRFP